jgi:hypothetical protein
MRDGELRPFVRAEAAASAILNALAWMDPETARKYREDASYKALERALSTNDQGDHR